MLELQKQFFDLYEIPKNRQEHRQYNYGQVSYGLEQYKLSQEQEQKGFIEIKYKKLTPTDFNDCVYWTEMHYPTIGSLTLLRLLPILDCKVQGNTPDEIHIFMLKWLIKNVDKVNKQEVQKVFS